MDLDQRARRNLIFQQLKPCCVELSQLALQSDGSTVKSKPVKESLDRLLNLLNQTCRSDDDAAFDDKLADYVFFPISHIFRQCEKQPSYLTEAAIKCLKFLLGYGWKNSITPELAKQLLFLLTFLAGDAPGVKGRQTATRPEELIAEAFAALNVFFKDVERSPKASAMLTDDTTTPALAHCITVIIDGVTEGASNEVQLEALQALESAWSCIKDRQVLATFLPGSVSALVKCLQISSKARRTRAVLATGLRVLGKILPTTLGDIWTKGLAEKPKPDNKSKALDESWLENAAAQVKLGLGSVIRLQRHESEEVRKALSTLCLKLLEECNKSLQDSTQILVETAIALSETEDEPVGLFQARETSLADLASIYPEIGQVIIDTMYKWMTSLPRVMQANDERAKQDALLRISKARKLSMSLAIDSQILNTTFMDSLKDSLMILLEQSPASRITETSIDSNAVTSLIQSNMTGGAVAFPPVLLDHEGQRDTRTHLVTALKAIGSTSFQIKMASEMLDNAQGGDGNARLAAMWLSLHLLKAADSSSSELVPFLDAELTSADNILEVKRDLYSFAVSLLSDSEDPSIDWRLQAMSLEVVAFTAQSLGPLFRTDLVDSLYPVVEHLGSPNARLREHAITSLNTISRACSYASASDLIVSNVDYMVNSVSLKLNTFDISPQAPQVLIMMIRLSGAPLLPYLDDVVGSIFAALDNFHGYPRLVEMLFSVLAEVVDEGAKSGQLQITDNKPAPNHSKSAPEPPSISSVISLIEKRKRTTQQQRPSSPPQDFPTEPWKSAATLLNESLPENPEDAEAPPEPMDIDTPAPPPTKTYKITETIARYTQHYLTSASPTLRLRLLHLLSTSSTLLSSNEDTFLPLVNDIWPVLLQRLYDPESIVVIAACSAISSLCRSAGDFMSTRIRTEWNEIMKLVRKTKENAKKEKRGGFSEKVKVWDAVVGLVMAVVGYVRVEDGMFDEALEVLGEEVVKRGDVRSVFEQVNGDAVWLLMQVMGQGDCEPAPVVKGWRFVDLVSV